MKRRIIAAVGDLIFAARIRGTAQQVGAEVEIARDAESLFGSAETDPPGAVLIDLQVAGKFGDVFALARRLKSDERLAGVLLVGFFAHVNTELMVLGREAGFDRVMPRSAFVQQLPALLAAASAPSDSL